MELEFVDAVCGASAVGFDSFEEKQESTSTHFHKSIFVSPYYPVDFDKQAALNFQTKESLKAGAIVNDRLGKVTGSVCQGEGRFEISWDRDGNTSMTLGGSVQDRDGNYVEVETTQSSDGSGSASVKGGNTNDD